MDITVKDVAVLCSVSCFAIICWNSENFPSPPLPFSLSLLLSCPGSHPVVAPLSWLTRFCLSYCFRLKVLLTISAHKIHIHSSTLVHVPSPCQTLWVAHQPIKFNCFSLVAILPRGQAPHLDRGEETNDCYFPRPQSRSLTCINPLYPYNYPVI